MIERIYEDCNLFYKLYIRPSVAAVEDYIQQPMIEGKKEKAYSYINAALKEYPEHCKCMLAYAEFWELEKEDVDKAANMLEGQFISLTRAADKLEKFDL